MSRSGRIHDLMAGAAAAAGAVGVVVGVPLALAAAVGWPPASGTPSIDAVITALRYGQIAPSTLLRVLAVVLWVAWAMSVVSIALEVLAVARGTVARALPGMRSLQTAAGHLVATILLLSSLPSRAAAVPAVAPPVSAAPASAAAQGAAPRALQPTTPQREARRAGDPEARVWVVRQRDSLWTIAERTLGDGRRWKEIAARNEGRTQADGGRLRPGDTLIRPGWRLELPPDARVARRQARATVADGDTMWGIAAERLGDGSRWREIFARNRGRRQAGGGRLTDPDLIHPGWVLRLPGDRRDAPREDAAAGDPPAPDDAPARHGDPTTPPAAGDAAGRHRGDLATPPAGDAAPGGVDPVARPAETDATPPPPVAPPVFPSTLRSDGAASVLGRGAHPLRDRPRPIGPAEPASRRITATDAAERTVLLSAAGLLAAGLVGLIARRRRHWLRRREAGAVLAPVDPEAAELERWLRSMAEHDLHVRLDRVLRMLTDHFAEHDIAPEVSTVELGEQVTLRLSRPLPHPPPGVTSSEDGRRWTLAPELEVGPTATRRYLPAAVACGRLPSGALLLANPLSIDVLGVVASRAQTADVLTSWAAELATGGTSSGVDVVVVGPHHPLVERLAGVTIVADDEQALDRMRRVIDDRGGFASHVVVLHGAPVPGEALDALASAARHPRAGLIVAGDDRTTARLEIAGRHTRLTPDGAWIDAPEWLTPRQWDRFGDLLRHPSHDHVPHPVPTAVLSLATLDSGEPATGGPVDPGDPALVEVGVLGAVTIDGRAASLDADAASLLTYLATYPTGADPDTLAATLWPWRPDRRERLARSTGAVADALADVDERAAVLRTDDGRVEVTSAVTTDLRTFRGLLHGLAQQPAAVQGRRLRAALELVRGEPFAAGADWAHADGLAASTAGLIVDVAHRLAMQALTVGDVDRASWAVDHGLLAAPDCELLYRDRMRVMDDRGDTAAVDTCMRDLRARVEADGGRVTAETIELYEQLRGGDAVTEDAS